MRPIAILLTVAALVAGACADDADPTGAGPATETEAEAPAGKERAPAKERARGEPGTTIAAAPSEFGEMLFDANRQAIYIFENDRAGDSVCYGDCAEAWPPVLTDGAPRADAGVDESLLGTIERRDGKTQVTYAGNPLYYYAHEAPGEVRCHNVNLNGGYWWVVGPDGERRP